MDSSQITRRQAQAIKVRVEDMRDYLHRLHVRMAKRGFPADDPLYLLVVEAQQSIGELYMDCCNRAYGGPSNTPPEIGRPGSTSGQRGSGRVISEVRLIH